ncbi:transposase [Streptomyces sioyaensis]|uniref:transposase n=1 Tax=Streptomyces sioyaensis TaxID=67364 RepID=UPI0037D6A9C8
MLLEQLRSSTRVFIGWEWATTTHDVTVMDITGNRIDRWELAHTEEGFDKTHTCLREHGDPTDLNYVEARVAAVNQLTALLDEHWPGGKAVFADSDIALAFLEQFPIPAAAATLTAGRLGAWCKRRGYSGKRPDSVLIERLRSAPTAASRLGEQVIEQLGRVQLQLVKGMRETIRSLGKAIAEAVATRPYAPLFATMPRVGKVNLGQIAGKIGPVLERAQSCEQLVAEGGVVPATRTSGKSHSVSFGFATNRRAHLALTQFADNSRHASD